MKKTPYANMTRKRVVLIAVVLLSNLAIVAGTIAFEWSPLTVIVLFVADALFGIVRILLERLFAGRPRGNATPPYLPYPVLDDLFENLLDKRGSIHISDRMPRLYPRNLPFVLGQWVTFLALIVLFLVTWFIFPLPKGSLDGSIVLVLSIFVAKHVLIVVTWTTTNVYQRASVTTIRPREILFTVLIAYVAFLSLVSQSSNVAQVAAATTFPVVPKLVFDFREAGIGPGLLVFDPNSDTVERPISTPAGKPRHIFQTNKRAVFRQAVSYGLFYTLWPGLYFIIAFGLAGLMFDSLTIVLAGMVVVLLIALSVASLVMWLGQANVEYRVHDDALVAYDRYLTEPQWIIPFEDIHTISTGENGFYSRILPFVKTPVKIECSTGEDFLLQYLDQPSEFVLIGQEMMVDQSTIA